MPQKEIQRRTFTRTMLACAVSLAPLSQQALAQAAPYPNRPLKIIVSFAAGGGSDVAARLLAKPLSEALGQPVIVENKPGGDGTIAGLEVAHAPPDGHTLFLATASPITYVPSIQLTKPPYDPLKAFAPVTHFTYYTYILVVHESVPARTFNEFVAYAKAHPGKISYGAGNATTHLALAQLEKSSNLDMTHIPYKGDSVALPDLRAGRIQAMLVAPDAIAQMEGRVRAIAVLGEKRSPLMPEIPTFAELGVHGVNIAPWSGIFVTGGTPAPIVERLSAELNKIFKLPEIQAQLNRAGSTLQGSSPEYLRDLVQSQLVIWKSAVKAANIPTH